MKDYKDLALQGQVLIDYLKVMVARHDWHGVSDAANDLRGQTSFWRRKIMAKLPYTFTICPDDEPPKLFTALTPRLLFAMRNGVIDMTIDQKQLIWPTSRKGVTTINNHKDKSNERI